VCAVCAIGIYFFGPVCLGADYICEFGLEFLLYDDVLMCDRCVGCEMSVCRTYLWKQMLWSVGVGPAGVDGADMCAWPVWVCGTIVQWEAR
jgi:hypothetical protein